MLAAAVRRGRRVQEEIALLPVLLVGLVRVGRRLLAILIAGMTLIKLKLAPIRIIAEQQAENRPNRGPLRAAGVRRPIPELVLTRPIALQADQERKLLTLAIRPVRLAVPALLQKPVLEPLTGALAVPTRVLLAAILVPATLGITRTLVLRALASALPPGRLTPPIIPRAMELLAPLARFAAPAVA